MTSDTDEQIAQAITEAQNGNMVVATRLLANVIKQVPNNIQAWYLLSQVVDNDERAVFCLERVLKFEPNNQQAQQRLQSIRDKMAWKRQSSVLPEVSPIPPAVPHKPSNIPPFQSASPLIQPHPAQSSPRTTPPPRPATTKSVLTSTNVMIGAFALALICLVCLSVYALGSGAQNNKPAQVYATIPVPITKEPAKPASSPCRLTQFTHLNNVFSPLFKRWYATSNSLTRTSMLIVSPAAVRAAMPIFEEILTDTRSADFPNCDESNQIKSQFLDVQTKTIAAYRAVERGDLAQARVLEADVVNTLNRFSDTMDRISDELR